MTTWPRTEDRVPRRGSSHCGSNSGRKGRRIYAIVSDARDGMAILWIAMTDRQTQKSNLSRLNFQCERQNFKTLKKIKENHLANLRADKDSSQATKSTNLCKMLNQFNSIKEILVLIIIHYIFSLF
jgi:hypothetical protein